jgi:AraC family transcriptional regulator
MEPKIIERGTTLLAGMVFYGDPFAGGEGWSQENEIGRLWGRFNRFWDDHQAELEAIANGSVGYELHVEPAEYAETRQFYVMVGVEVPSPEGLPLELSVKALPAGSYAVFALRGPEMTSNWPDAIYKGWLPGSGYEEASKFTLERYDGDRFKGVDDPESELEIWVPVREAGDRDASGS